VFLLSPKSYANPWSESSDRELDLGGVDPRVLFITSCSGVTDLTGARDQSDRCDPQSQDRRTEDGGAAASDWSDQ
jgi:hypothetical protein